jgi:rhodanese-related sulfurtransferase
MNFNKKRTITNQKFHQMKKLFSYLFMAMLVPALFLTSCKDKNEDPIVKGTYADLQTYMIANSMDLPTLLTNWVVDPKPVADGGIVEADGTIPTYHVFDIRGAEDFAKGHVKGAINVLLPDVLTKAAEVGKDKPILVFCLTGQTAGRAVMALRLSGYSDAQVAKFGFSAWTNISEFDKWSANTGNIADGSPNWNTDASSTPSVNLLPTWESTSTDGATILAERVQEMLAASGWSVKSVDVLSNPTGFSIFNYWGEADYLKYGHFTGAYQYLPIAFDKVTSLNPDASNLVYCYTGQTSSITTAWFNVLGYKVQSIAYGVNSLKYDELLADGKSPWHFPYHSYAFEGTLAK